MGCASRVTPGRSHSDSAAASLPIENSPPGTQTIPAGVGPAGRSLCTTVGTNVPGEEGADGVRHAHAMHNAPHTPMSTREAFAITPILYTRRPSTDGFDTHCMMSRVRVEGWSALMQTKDRNRLAAFILCACLVLPGVWH